MQQKRHLITFLLGQADISAPITVSMSRYDRTGRTRKTALHIAAADFNFHWVIPDLLQRGANVNKKYRDDKTPMDLVIGCLGQDRALEKVQEPWSCLIRTLQLLARSGAKPTYTDREINSLVTGTMRNLLTSPTWWSLDTADKIAAHHSMTVQDPDCFHITKKCARDIRCSQRNLKKVKANKDLITACQRDVLKAVNLEVHT